MHDLGNGLHIHSFNHKYSFKPCWKFVRVWHPSRYPLVHTSKGILCYQRDWWECTATLAYLCELRIDWVIGSCIDDHQIPHLSLQYFSRIEPNGVENRIKDHMRRMHTCQRMNWQQLYICDGQRVGDMMETGLTLRECVVNSDPKGAIDKFWLYRLRRYIMIWEDTDSRPIVPRQWKTWQSV